MYYSHFNQWVNHSRHSFIGTGSFWTAIAVIIALIGLVIAWYQLNHIRQTSRADFAKRFIDTFFTDATRTLFALLMNSALEFKVLDISNEQGEKIDQLPYLKIKKAVLDQLKGLVKLEADKEGYTAFEVDDLLLGQFDDLGWYYKQGLIDFETIDQAFGYYITNCMENSEIKKYLTHEGNDGKYADLHFLYSKLEDISRHP